MPIVTPDHYPEGTLSPDLLPVSCNKDCGAGCPLVACMENGRVARIVDNPLRDEYVRGCLRGYRMAEVLYAEDRVTKPLIRVDRGRASGRPAGSTAAGNTVEAYGSRFREATWEEAIRLTAERLGEIRETLGPQAVFAMTGSGACRGVLHNTGILGRRFFACFGGSTGMHGGYSAGAVSFVAPYLFGTRAVGFDPPTLLDSKLIVLWGYNPLDTRFSCRIEGVLEEAVKRGIRIVGVDPRRSRSIRDLKADWVPIRPGTDAVLMAAVAYVLLDEDLADLPGARRITHGVDEFVDYIRGTQDGCPKTPSWAEPVCGLPAAKIAEFAREYGRAKPAALLPGLSIQRVLGGEEAYRFSAALQALTGNVGKSGGSSGGEFWGKLPNPRFPRIPVPPMDVVTEDMAGNNDPQNVGAKRTGTVNPSIPVYRWPDAVIEGRDGGYPSDIACIFNSGTNYLNQGADIGKNRRAFEKVAFSVTADYFLTPTAAACDVILPATTFLEREDVTVPADGYLFYSTRVSQPIGQARTDYDIYADLADSLGFRDRFTEGRTAEEWLEKLLDESEIDDIERFKTCGIYRGEWDGRVGLRDFAADPQSHPLATPSGKIEIRSESYARDTGFSPLPECRPPEPPEGFSFRMVTPHSRYRINSQHSNRPWFPALEPPVLTMNREDAGELGLSDGETARVIGEVGAMEIKLSLSDDIMRGIVSLPQGAWSRMNEDGVEIGGSVNAVVSTDPTLPSHSSRSHSVFVGIRKD